MCRLDKIPSSLLQIRQRPEKLYYKGDVTLLQKPMVSIVGTRRPIAYTKEATMQLARAFGEIGYVVVSGGAMGVDAMAHRGAFPHTIAVMANGLDIIYPKVNQALIEDIYRSALALSEYEAGERATKYSFVVRNRLVVALGEVLIITQADANSGTMRSAEIAQQMGKKIYVLPHRLGESAGTEQLLREGLAEPIWDIGEFVGCFGRVDKQKVCEDALLAFCASHPLLSEVVARFGEEVYLYELEGKVIIKNLRVYPA